MVRQLQLTQITPLASTGIKNVEVGTIDPAQFERIPKKHFDEMKQLAKLQGVKLSMHAPPVLDMAGFDQQSNRWSEELRKASEAYLRDYLEKAAKLQDDVNVPVPMVLHASGHIQAKDGLHWVPDKTSKNSGKWVADVLTVVNPETGQIAPLEKEERYYPQIAGPRIMTPEARLAELNRSQWDQTQLQITNYNYELEETRRRIGEIRHYVQQLADAARNVDLNAQQRNALATYEQQVKNLQSRETLLSEYLSSAVMGNFDKLYRSKQYYDIKSIEPDVTNVSEREELRKRYEVFYNDLPEEKQKFVDVYKNEVIPAARAAQRANVDWDNDKHNAEKASAFFTAKEKYDQAMLNYSSQIFNKFREWQQAEIVPQTFVPVEHFAKKKAPETWAKALYDTYKKFEGNEKKLPIMAIENWDVKNPMGLGDDLREGINNARNKFVEFAKRDGMQESEARKIANKHIGATWDVGHINFLRKYMDPKLSEKERIKFITDETAKIAPDIKHMHLHDNFGFQDIHIAPGSGNVPFKEIAEELRKHGKIGKDSGVRQILESYAAMAELKYNPHQETLTSLGAPVYSSGTGTSWGQWENYLFGSHGYQAGYGDMLPQIHHQQLYGAGFSNLPAAVGGPLGGLGGQERSRFAGAPMS